VRRADSSRRLATRARRDDLAAAPLAVLAPAGRVAAERAFAAPHPAARQAASEVALERAERNERESGAGDREH